MNKLTHSSFLFKAPVDLVSLLLQLVAQLLLGPLLLFLQEAQLSQLLPPEENHTNTAVRVPPYCLISNSLICS